MLFITTQMMTAYQTIGLGFIITSLELYLMKRMMMTGGLFLLAIMVGGIIAAQVGPVTTVILPMVEAVAEANLCRSNQIVL